MFYRALQEVTVYCRPCSLLSTWPGVVGRPYEIKSSRREIKRILLHFITVIYTLLVLHCKLNPSTSLSLVPPEKVLMLDEQGVHIPSYILGPYNEDSAINITCVSIGGELLLRLLLNPELFFHGA